MSERNLAIELAKIIGEPIDPNLKVPAILAEVADCETALPGEDVKRYTTEDSNAGDEIYTITNGIITPVKVTPQIPTPLTFTGLQSRLEYVLVEEIMASPDQSLLARRKAAIARAMDKKETKEVLDLILGAASQEVVQATGEDIYDVIVKMTQLVEDFGDNYILLAGSTAKGLIDTYDKVNADNFRYRVGINDLLTNSGIKLVKVIGEYKLDGASATKVLAINKLILVARNSTIAQGKPLSFVRRIISPAIAEAMGCQVDVTQRALIVVPTPVVVSGSSLNTLAYGVYAYESKISALLNKRAVAWATVA